MVKSAQAADAKGVWSRKTKPLIRWTLACPTAFVQATLMERPENRKPGMIGANSRPPGRPLFPAATTHAGLAYQGLPKPVPSRGMGCVPSP
jgi:hypothetical protein